MEARRTLQMITPSITRRRFVWGLGQAAMMTSLGARASHAVQGALYAGMVRYIGAQQDIFITGRANAALSLRALAGLSSLYALGPVAYRFTSCLQGGKSVPQAVPV